MPKISIITDSDAGLPDHIADQYGIRQVPITVNFDHEVYETGVDIDDYKLFELIDKNGKLPTTAAPSPGKFAQAYKAAFEQDQADEILCLTVSAAMSGTYDAARVAATEIIGSPAITVLDTQSLSLAQGFMVLAAADAVKDGASREEAAQAARSVGERTHLYGALATLKYIAMSGRVSSLKADLANLLSIKPVLTLQEGKLDMLEQVRTRKKAWGRMIELLARDANDKPIEQMAIVHSAAYEDAMAFKEKIVSEMNCPEEIMMAEFTAGLSVHAGAGMIGAAIVTSE
jgi:DegV family protein with EDD domain